ncbi:MAG: ABC transporter ATP-binding protein [Candidatus Caldatribacteriaceae bacterium]
MDAILKTVALQAFYVLEVLGEKKIVRAVNGVEMKVFRNEIYGIAGESGCGKTTLLKTLFGAIEPPLRIFGGKVLYRTDGEWLDALSLNGEAQRKLRFAYIAYIPQGSMGVFNPVKRLRGTFLDFLKSHVEGKRERELFTLAEEHLVKLGLMTQVLDAYPHQLSGGMRQRVAIALATLLQPRLILADEPTTALDVVAQRAVLQLLREVQKEFQSTIILVTHDMGVHAQVTDRIAIMYAGKIVEEGPTRDIFAAPLHPYTQYLIHSLPKIGDKRTRESVPGSPPSPLHLPSGCAFHPRCPYAIPLCQEEEPPLETVNTSHRVACFLRRSTGNGHYS